MRDKIFSHRIKREAGVSAIDMLITVAVIAVVTSFSVVGINSAQQRMRLARSAQLLSRYIDKARLAAIRCHCTTTVEISSSGTFTVNGPIKSATTETVSLPLDQNVGFQNFTAPVTITFDWRGRADNDYHLTLANSYGTRRISLSGGGDVKIDSNSNYNHAPEIKANMPTDLSDGATDSYVTSFANNNSNSNTTVSNPKNHKKPKK